MKIAKIARFRVPELDTRHILHRDTDVSKREREKKKRE